MIRLLGIKPDVTEEKEEKELQLYVVNSTLHFIEYELYPRPDERISLELIKKYAQLAGKLAGEISMHLQNEKYDDQIPVRTVTDLQKAQIEIAI